MNYNWNWGIFWQPAADGSGTWLHDAGPRARLDARHRALRLGHRARAGLDRRRDPHDAAQVGGAARQRLRRALPQHPAAGADVPLVLRAARAPAEGARATAIKQMPPPWSVVRPGGARASASSPSARVAEQVRAGIQSLPRGQRMAGTALGLTLPQTYRYVLLPMAFRIIMPPLTSEFHEHHQEHARSR